MAKNIWEEKKLFNSFVQLINFFFWCKSNLLILTYWENIKKKTRKNRLKEIMGWKKYVIMFYFDKNFILSKGWIIIYYTK
jgi:hypothetical protein